MNQKITSSDKQKILKLFKCGISFCDIAKQMNLHESTIGNFIKKAIPEHKQSRGAKPKTVFEITESGEVVNQYENAKHAGDSLGMNKKSVYAKMSAYTPLSNGNFITMSI